MVLLIDDSGGGYGSYGGAEDAGDPLTEVPFVLGGNADMGMYIDEPFESHVMGGGLGSWIKKGLGRLFNWGRRQVGKLATKAKPLVKDFAKKQVQRGIDSLRDAAGLAGQHALNAVDSVVDKGAARLGGSGATASMANFTQMGTPSGLGVDSRSALPISKQLSRIASQYSNDPLKQKKAKKKSKKRKLTGGNAVSPSKRLRVLLGEGAAPL